MNKPKLLISYLNETVKVELLLPNMRRYNKFKDLGDCYIKENTELQYLLSLPEIAVKRIFAEQGLENINCLISDVFYDLNKTTKSEKLRETVYNMKQLSHFIADGEYGVDIAKELEDSIQVINEAMSLANKHKQEKEMFTM